MDIYGINNQRETWKYKSKEKRSTGYEDLYPVLDEYTPDRYKSASSEEKLRMVDDVYNIYRSRDIFPITYFNEDGVQEEIIKHINSTPSIKNDVVVNSGAGGSSALCNFMMPNLYDAYNSINGNGSAFFKFSDEAYLKQCVRFALRYCESVRPKQIMKGMTFIKGIPSNFSPMCAKALYEAYCPEGGVIHDSSSGFGGRLLAALTSVKNFSYVGTEPNSITHENLVRLGNAVNEVRGRENTFKIIKMGSEDFKVNTEIFDFSFSSVPYYNLEYYIDEPTQCYIKFSDVYSWIDGFVKPTIDNTYYMLKRDKYYAINIADFKCGSRTINYVELWKDLSIKAGFTYVKDLYLQANLRPRMGAGSRLRKERIMLFYKE